MADYLVVKPAYGRKLNSKKAIKESYEKYQDFEVLDMFHKGRYVNKQEVDTHGLELEVRYGKRLEKLMFLP